MGIAASSYRSLPHWGRGTASAVDRVLSFIVDLRRIPPLVFHAARTPSGLLRSPPSPRGEGFVHRYCFPHISCIRFDDMGIAVFSYRKPSPLGKGDRAAVDRVLSFIACLRQSFPLVFHTARTLSGSLRSPPSPRGEGFVSGIPLFPSNLRPFGAPSSYGRRECPRDPLPLEGAAERSEAGLASAAG